MSAYQLRLLDLSGRPLRLIAAAGGAFRGLGIVLLVAALLPATSALALADPAETVEASADPITERGSLLLPSLGAQIEEKLQQQTAGTVRFVPLSLQAWQLAAEGAHFRVLGELRSAEQAPRQIEVRGLIARDNLALGALRVSDPSSADPMALPEAAAAATARSIKPPASDWLQQNVAGWSAQQGLANADPRPWP